MTTTQHTPGPLEACPECGNTWLTLKADNGRVDSATCEACRYHWHVGVNVAAEPELLECLKLAYGAYCGTNEIWHRIERAIAKAEGRS